MVPIIGTQPKLRIMCVLSNDTASYTLVSKYFLNKMGEKRWAYIVLYMYEK